MVRSEVLRCLESLCWSCRACELCALERVMRVAPLELPQIARKEPQGTAAEASARHRRDVRINSSLLLSCHCTVHRELGAAYLLPIKPAAALQTEGKREPGATQSMTSVRARECKHVLNHSLRTLGPNGLQLLLHRGAGMPGPGSRLSHSCRAR